jgi:hypothetical protein
MSTEIALTPAIYTHEAVVSAAEAFQHLCRVHIRSTDGDVRIAIDVPTNRAEIVDEFLNYLLGLSAQQLLG